MGNVAPPGRVQNVLLALVFGCSLLALLRSPWNAASRADGSLGLLTSKLYMKGRWQQCPFSFWLMQPVAVALEKINSENFMRTPSSGFTLMEIAIVLSVFGLVVGGIILGQSMVRTSALLGVTSDVQRISTAVNQFRTQYGSLPGDMRTATSYFSGAVNGNGNSRIGQFPGTEYGEVFQVAYQLSQAGLLEGRFTGTGTSRAMVPGTNVPKSKLDDSIGYTVVYWGGYTDASDFTTMGSYGYALQRGHALLFGRSESGTLETYGKAISAEEALMIDGKADDGKPQLGKYVVANPAGSSDCVTSAAGASALYNVRSKVKEACGLIIGITPR